MKTAITIMTLRDHLRELEEQEVYSDQGECLYPLLNDGATTWAPSSLLGALDGAQREAEATSTEALAEHDQMAAQEYAWGSPTALVRVLPTGYLDSVAAYTVEDRRPS